MSTLTIITPSMRLWRLPAVQQSVLSIRAVDGWELRWLVGIAPPQPDWDAHCERWEALLASVTTGWWIIVSDDNLAHPGILEGVCEAARAGATVAMFGQIQGATNREVPKGAVRSASVDQLTKGACWCDGGQFAVSAQRWKQEEWKWFNDARALAVEPKDFPRERGVAYERWLFKAMYELNPGQFAFIDKALTYHDGQNL